MGRTKHLNPMKHVNWPIVKKLEKLSYNFDSTTHFNPQNYCTKVDERLQNYKTSRHQKYVANYHIVWVTRGRCKIFFKEIRILLKQFIEEETKKHSNWDIYACEVMPEHIHMFVSLDHLTVPAQFVGIVRNTIMKKIQELFPILTEALGEEIFSRSFYSGTIGNVTGLGLLSYINKQWESEKSKRYYETKAYLEKQNMNLTQFF
jgi:putative transposase